MTAAIPTDEPTRARAGDTWKWTRTLADYPASAWTLTYYLKHPTADRISIVATASGDDHSVTVAQNTSSTYTPGTWSWIASVDSGTEKHTVDTGTIIIEPDYRASTGALDDRSHARKTLVAIEAWIEGHDLAVAEYEIAGRRMKYIPITELVKLRDLYKGEVAREDDAIRVANGLPSRRKLLVRFTGN